MAAATAAISVAVAAAFAVVVTHHLGSGIWS